MLAPAHALLARSAGRLSRVRRLVQGRLHGGVCVVAAGSANDGYYYHFALARYNQ